MLAAATLGGVAGTAVAGDGQVEYYKFAPDKTDDFVNYAAASASKGRFTLLVKGVNGDVLRAAYTLAQEIEQTTPFEVYFLHSERSGPISDLRLLTNGQVITSIQVGGDIDGMKQALSQGFQRGSGNLAELENDARPGVS
ncbi:MAG: hypothetical protein HQ481_18110 [Alphaproteobacteria bacterium]|nr:hypothetical protein [Alphaproteobacteria bacterium]